MRRVTIAVIGSAKTTRANVEALISDVLDSVDEATIALVYDTEASDGQVWAKQYAESRDITVSEYPYFGYSNLVEESKGSGLSFFILWDDEDPDCLQALSIAQKFNINAYDLTEGLMGITPKQETIVAPEKPEIPEAEAEVSEVSIEPELSAPDELPGFIKAITDALQGTADVSISEELIETADDLDDFVDEDEEETAEVAMLALEMLAKVMAKHFVAEVKKLLAE